MFDFPCKGIACMTCKSWKKLNFSSESQKNLMFDFLFKAVTGLSTQCVSRYVGFSWNTWNQINFWWKIWFLAMKTSHERCLKSNKFSILINHDVIVFCLHSISFLFFMLFTQYWLYEIAGNKNFSVKIWVQTLQNSDCHCVCAMFFPFFFFMLLIQD